MPQSLAKIYLHIIFSTKRREKFISGKIRPELHSYLTEVIFNLNSYVHEIYANPEHIHILCELPRTITIAQLILKIKTSSSIWMKTKGVEKFEWQKGYGAFSVSHSKVEIVKTYIQKQPEHHQKWNFENEFRIFLKEYNIEFDERYVWD
jgi:REP element-mobilizing transposase RayT